MKAPVSGLVGVTVAVVLLLAFVLVDASPFGGGQAGSGAEPTARPSEPAPRGPEIRDVPPAQWDRMKETGMVRPGCPVQERDELRRVELDFYDFSGDLQRGYLVVRKDVAESVSRIFTRLLEEKFPIRRMEGVENYGGDVKASLEADNTSAYNCRRLDQINAPPMDSPHANGRAVDINPRENPWMDLRCDCWVPGPENSDRFDGPGKILLGGVVWRAFRDEGWIWQNISVADYMHFDTGYPSRPFR